MKPLLAVLALLATAAIAQTVTDQYAITVKPWNYRADVAMDQRLRVNKVVTFDGGVVGAQTGIASGTWDFPALGNGELELPCAESATLTVPGTIIGDACLASSNLGQDGGARLIPTATLSCSAVTGGAVFQLCVRFTDAGTYNLHDAGFTARTYR